MLTGSRATVLSVLVAAAALACSSEPTDPAGSGGTASEGGMSGGGMSATGGSLSSGGETSAGGMSTGGGGGEGGGVVEDACLMTTAACPETPDGLVSGSGLVPIDRCAFPLEEHGFEDSGLAAQLSTALTNRTMAEVLADLNRSGTTESGVVGNPANVTQAFGWNSGDQNVDYWIPQGITGSADARANGLVEGRELVLASWYYDMGSDPGSTGEKGVRVSLADVTNPAAVAYRHLLLVEPVLDGAQIDFEPIEIHAGGLAWVDDYLYVADTTHGFRVFDMAGILEVAPGDSSIGYHRGDGVYYAGNYKYVVPQVGRYERLGTCNPRFSFVALDRSTAPPSLVSGEYSSSTLYGRLFHWPLATGGNRLTAPISFPSRSFFAVHSHLQGAVSSGATHWLSSSEPPAGRGDLYVAAEATQSQIHTWVDAPEDLQLDAPRNKLWSLSEGHGERFVFAVSPIP